MASVSLREIYKKYAGGVIAVSDFNIEIKDKEFIILVGPSGCGKSTTLRMIAGLEEISEGELYIGDRLVNDIAPKDRDIAMVFQNYALYPHMTVFENMAFGLKLRKVPKDEIARKVEEAARILDIAHLLDRKPKALSGGQRQRVALGRAIVREPQVFLLDEPLSNLDAKLRAQMRTEISKLHKKLGTTFIYVTHDQTEAMTMGDPVSYTHLYQVTVPESKVDPEVLEPLVDQEVVLGVRPECIHDEPAFLAQATTGVINTTVEVTEMMGAETYLYLNCEGIQLTARVSPRSDVRPQDELKVAIDPNRIHIFDKETEKAVLN